MGIRELAIFLGGLSLGAVLTICLGFPRIGRAAAKSLGVFALAAGFGLLVWASVSLYRGESMNLPIYGDYALTYGGESFGWGGALFLGGLVTLIVSRRQTQPKPQQAEEEAQDTPPAYSPLPPDEDR
ncbi:hypothetical protein Isop_1010 [Isosphaera pallida ATCC 43644]|uniref:Uncharacterized protein n=1 Tax=Isosphaera pallida (strain ATCC 43644 / DSM 9630 / IS1B) TaxID=575540 RepID=E8R412_ISOPI|nr:hypothetical protein [Isosphaera pallida]ADV61599.1 hypothetical protein Isop_1010 [Isosphaera pallida ATCC 43644]